MFLVYFLAFIVRASKNPRQAEEIEENISIAVDTLCQMGFSRKQAINMVSEISREYPGATYEELINMALRK